jgi:hypothetical protein
LALDLQRCRLPIELGFDPVRQGLLVQGRHNAPILLLEQRIDLCGEDLQ